MADTTAFDALTAKLPPDHQSCFVEISAQIQSLPPGDDLALALEAFGFAALVLKEFPGEITESIDQVQLGVIDTPHEGIERGFAGWLDESRYKRLRETLRLVKQPHRQSQRINEWIVQSCSKTDHRLAGHGGLLRIAVFGLCAGAAWGSVLLCVGALPHRAPANAGVPTMFDREIIRYQEAEIPDLGSNVGIVLVGGEVLVAFKEQDCGVVVIKPLSTP